jgi:hypothetical protein
MKRNTDYQPLFPWFGGKSPVADAVWSGLGDCRNYVEPFFGSGAVLFLRPDGPGPIETVNDADGLLANFWRALQHDSNAVAEHADWPVNEADLHARHLWLLGQRERITEKLMGDPEFFDAKAAGWWCWGQCCWIGSGWCSGKGPWISEGGEMVLRNSGKGVKRQLPHLGDSGKGVNRQRPHLRNSGNGVNRQRPHLGNSGNGVNRQRPHLGDSGKGVNRKPATPAPGRQREGCEPETPGDTRQRPSLNGSGSTGIGILRGVAPDGIADRREWLIDYLNKFSERLARVRVCCGDWSRVCGPSVTFRHGLTGVFLDPPYADSATRTENLYATDCEQVAHAVRKWAIEQGENPLMRICLAGYDGEHQMPATWRVHEWEATGGYGLISDDEEATGRSNKGRERLWFSPACISPDKMPQRSFQFTE